MAVSCNTDCNLLQLSDASVTAEEAEEKILTYLRDYPGTPVNQWEMINRLCTHPGRTDNRRERQFYLKQLLRLHRERKVKRYRTVRLRRKVRISEALL